MGYLISSIGIGIYLIIFIIFLINKIDKIIRTVDVHDIADGLGLACLFLVTSIVFLILVILELINKCS